MEKVIRTILKTLAITMALVFVGAVMLTTVDNLFGGSKVRTLFGMSADALAGGEDASVRHRSMKTFAEPADAGQDAGEASAAQVIEPTFMPASKSAGGEGLPGVREKLRGRPGDP